MESLELDHFAPHVGSVFRVEDGDGGPVELVLIEAQSIRPSPGAPRQDPFTLLFRGPRERYLPQRMYRIAHPELDELTLFLIPRLPDEEGSYFEAIFN